MNVTMPRLTVFFLNRQLHAVDGATLYRQCSGDDELDFGTMRTRLASVGTKERLRLLWMKRHGVGARLSGHFIVSEPAILEFSESCGTDDIEAP
jgi:hypothetical protein